MTLVQKVLTIVLIEYIMQVNQLPVGVHSMAACEAVLLADKLGIKDHQALQEVLATSLGCSEVLKRHMPIINAR